MIAYLPHVAKVHREKWNKQILITHQVTSLFAFGLQCMIVLKYKLTFQKLLNLRVKSVHLITSLTHAHGKTGQDMARQDKSGQRGGGSTDRSLLT